MSHHSVPSRDDAHAALSVVEPACDLDDEQTRGPWLVIRRVARAYCDMKPASDRQRDKAIAIFNDSYDVFGPNTCNARMQAWRACERFHGIVVESSTPAPTVEQPTDRTSDACAWTEDNDGIYHTTCGNAFNFVVDGPVENGMRWCGYCGKALAVERYASDVEGDDEGEKPAEVFDLMQALKASMGTAGDERKDGA